MILTRVVLLVFAALGYVAECRQIRFKTSRRPIDELLAKAGDMIHSRANQNGKFKAFGKRARDSRGVLIEYDIMVEESVYDKLKRLPLPDRFLNRLSSKRSSRSGRGKRAAAGNTWPNARILYSIRNDYSSSDRNTIKDAIEEFNKYTCVQWVERSSEDEYVDIQKGDGCWSYIGKTYSRSPQTLSLGSNCIYTKVIVHEMMHAAGAFHEQSRIDRDKYITINWGNIQESAKRNFNTRDNAEDHGIPYDYRSVMHYSPRVFSSNGKPTITTKDPDFQDVIGTAPTLGENDIRLLSRLYKCDQVPACKGVTCPSGAVVGKGCQCFCPTGDVKNPMAPCTGGGSGGPTCTTLNDDCGCSSNSDCSSMDNARCSSGACVCLSGYERSENDCVEEDTSPTCTTLNADCGCNSNSDCSSMDNARCSSGACVCPSGYERSENDCVEEDTSPTCTTLNADCSCNSNSDCSSMDNARCSNGACVCPSGYERSENDCVEESPTCTTLNADCGCSSNSDCSSMDNTRCSSGACVCLSGYERSGNDCEKSPTGGSDEVILDGSKISPFRVIKGRWVSRSGTDTSSNGVSSNGKYLYCTSRSSSSHPDTLESPTLTGAGDWCLSLSGLFQNTKLSIIAFAGNFQKPVEILSGTSRNFYTLRNPYKFSTSSTIKVQIKAEPRSGSSHTFRLDNVKLARC